MKITEAHIQAVLIRWAMLEKHHVFTLPNSNQFYPWEADLLTMTRACLVHEFEIKLTLSDYRADAHKRKHLALGPTYGPSYFWYATFNLEIEPPAHAGWLLITKTDGSRNHYRNYGWVVDVKKEAPRLNEIHLHGNKLSNVCSMLSFRLMHFYARNYIRQGSGDIAAPQLPDAES